MNIEREPLDAEEAALAAHYRALPAREPGAALDAAVLAQARAAVAPRHRPHPLSRWGLSAAAAAVLSIVIVGPWIVQQSERAPVPVQTQLQEIAPAAKEAPAPEQAPAAQPASAPAAAPVESAAPAGATADAPPTAGADAVHDQRRAASRSDDAATEAGLLDQAPAAPKPRAETRPEAPAEPEPFPAPPIVLDEPTPMSVAAPPPTPPAPPAPPADMAPAPEAADRAARSTPIAPVETMAAPPAPAAPAPAAQSAPSVQEERAPPARLGVTGASAGAGERDATRADAERTEQRKAVVERARQQLPEPEPEEWLAAIRRLLAAGDETAARAEMRRFVQRHPDHPLPRDLQPLRDPP